MRRFLAVFLAMFALAVAACHPPPPGPSTVNVQVFCNDETGPGIGAILHPRVVHTEGAPQVTFNIRPTPGNLTVSTTLDSVPQRLWAFQDNTYQSPDTMFAAPIRADMAALGGVDTTYYKLTLTCSGNVIVIDPIVIVDDPPPPR